MKLLVSVRSAAEASALRGSECAIVDVKEPTRGALGMSDPSTVAGVAATADRGCVLSVALGEAVEFDSAVLPDRFHYFKLGLAGFGSGSAWEQDWLAARSRVLGKGSPGAPPPQCVAVIYADHVAAEAPKPGAIVDAAIRTGCAVTLVDTFVKRPGGSLFEELAVAELVALREQSHAAGLLFAIAGQLRSDDAERIVSVMPDIVGIRGAACRNANRRSEIDPGAVSEFSAALQTASGSLTR